MDRPSSLLLGMDIKQTPAKLPNLVLDIPPLSFDRVYNGLLTTSVFPLFRMPVELLGHILQYFTTKDLMALRLVDRDCLRLATPSTFKDIKLWYAPESYSSMFDEAPTTMLRLLPSPDIAFCIRRLTVTSDPSGRHTPNYLRNDGDPSPENTELPLNSFTHFLCNLVETMLPNLHILEWTAPIAISTTTLRSIFACPANHLRLENVVIYEEEDVPYDSNDILLETLSIDVGISSIKPRPPLFFDSIFRRTHSTLRQLKWTGDFDADDTSLTSDLFRFPCLRSLTLDTVSRNSDNILQLFIGPDTRVETLAMDTMTPSTYNFIGTRGYMPSLKNFCWLIHDQGSLVPYNAILEFIKENTQLEALHIPGPASPSFLTQSLLPTLKQHFNSLTSLHLVWAASDIDEEALEALATMTSLHVLWLSAGNQQGIRNSWEIHHDSIIKHLSRLTHLQTLAFSRDTYAMNVHPLAPRSCDYYSSYGLPVDLDISKYLSPTHFDAYQGRDADFTRGRAQQIAMRRLAWESWHAEQMMTVGHRYEAAFPKLSWFFVGQLEFTPSPAGVLELAHQLPQRDPCLTALQKKMSITLWRPV